MAFPKLARPSRRAWAFSALFGLFCSGSLGAALWSANAGRGAGLARWQLVCVLAGVFAVACAVFIAAVAWSGRGRGRKKASRLERIVPMSFDCRGVLTGCALVVLCWLAWLVVQFPGTMNGDTLNELYQFKYSAPTYYTTGGYFTDAEYIDHHPVFDTLYYGAFLWLGEQLGSQTLGFFSCVVVQFVLAAAALSLACCYTSRFDAPYAVRFAMLLFVALFPSYPQWMTSVVKDSLFVIPWIAYLVCYSETVRTKGESWRRAGFVAAFIVAATLCALTKKTGMYVTGLSTAVLVLLYRPRIRLAAGFAVPVFISAFLFPALVFPAIGGVEPGGPQEAICMPIQQVTCVLKYAGDDVSDEDRQAIDEVIDSARAVENYRWSICDPAKNTFHRGATRGQVAGFLAVWLKLAATHPVLCLKANAAVTASLFAPTAACTYYSDQSHIERKEAIEKHVGYVLDIDVEGPSWLGKVADKVHKAYNVFAGYTWNLPFKRGFWGGWLPVFCFLLAWCRDRESVALFVPALATMLTFLVSPVSSMRYILPLLFAVPLLVGVALRRDNAS